MSKDSISSNFASIYNALPADAQHALVVKDLIPLLDCIDRTQATETLVFAANLKKQHADIPVLDLRAKRREINALLDELHRDAKRSFVKERSQRNDLLHEIVDSLTEWLNDIWSVVYEHKLGFLHAHQCLLLVAGTLENVANVRSSCRCTFHNMFINVSLKNRAGKLIKNFDIDGAHNIEQILYFIWRDLFLSMLTSGSRHQASKIPGMLEDIEDLLGWTALERVYYGGRKCPHDYEHEDADCDFETEWGGESEDEESEGEDDGPFPGPLYARHWSYRLSRRMPHLRDHIQGAMTAVFKLTPSRQLFNALHVLSEDPLGEMVQLLQCLDEVATSSPETFAAALDIHTGRNDAKSILRLLDTHAHLLRPRDALSLQAAVTVVGTGNNPTHQVRALQTIEKELIDTARSLRSALLGSFSQLDQRANQKELQHILKMPAGADRQDRIEAWIDAISTPGTNTPNPMAFAAMMFGLPLVPGMDMSEDADPLGYLDLDPHDPDLEDLREEFRPMFKQRFENWVEIAQLVKGGSDMQFRVFREVVELMPFLRANDVVDEIVSRLADRPSKHHICDGLDALLLFVKQQVKQQKRKARSLHRQRDGQNQKQRRGTTGHSQPSSHNSSAQPEPSVISTGLPAFIPAQNTFIPPAFGGIDDVD